MCQHCLTAALPIVLPSLCLLFRFLANNGNGKLSLTAISCTSKVLSSICGDGENRIWTCERYRRWTAGHCALHQCTAEWERDRTSYIEIRSTGCGPPAEETPQSRGNYWRACCVAAELYTILRKVQPSSLRNCSICLRKVWTYIIICIHSKISNRTRSLASLTLAARQLSREFVKLECFSSAYTIDIMIIAYNNMLDCSPLL